MKRVIWGMIFLLTLAAMPAAAEGAAQPSILARVGILGGAKFLDDNDWNPVEQQWAIGLRSDWGYASWPVYIAADVTYSSGDGSFNGQDVDGHTVDGYIGIRKYFNLPMNGAKCLTPYFGGGLNIVSAKASSRLGIIPSEADDNGIGFWVGGGALYPLDANWSIGADLKYSKTKLTMNGVDVEAGGFSPMASLVYNF